MLAAAEVATPVWPRLAVTKSGVSAAKFLHGAITKEFYPPPPLKILLAAAEVATPVWPRLTATKSGVSAAKFLHGALTKEFIIANARKTKQSCYKAF